jgi:hypothetical protein
MLIREAGILLHGLPVAFNSYHRASKDDADLFRAGGIISGLLSFAECVMSPVEYFESEKYSIVFKKGQIEDSNGKEKNVVAFIVLDKDERIDKYLRKTILPLLKRMLKKFISQYNGSNLYEVNKYKPFKKTINKLFSTGTLTFEEKVISLLS